MAEFGEYVHYMPLRGDVDDKRQAKADMAPRFIYGIFLALSDRSDELIVFNKDEGIRKARTIHRLPDEQRWNRDALLEVKGSLLLPNPGQSDSRIRTSMDPGISVESNLHEPITKEDIAREMGEHRPFYLLRTDIRKVAEKIGYTKDCKGCRAVEMNFSSRPMHSNECRRRMEEEMRKSSRGEHG